MEHRTGDIIFVESLKTETFTCATLDITDVIFQCLWTSCVWMSNAVHVSKVHYKYFGLAEGFKGSETGTSCKGHLLIPMDLSLCFQIEGNPRGIVVGSGFLRLLASCVQVLDCGTLLVFLQMAVISDRDNPCLECRQFISSDSGIETLKWPVVFCWKTWLNWTWETLADYIVLVSP